MDKIKGIPDNDKIKGIPDIIFLLSAMKIYI
jgi:hypothetical protein